MNPSALIYDTEIVRCIPPRGLRDPNLEYCEGWQDHAGMGISVIAVYDFIDDAYRVFLEDNLLDFAALVRERDHVIGFNSLNFDDKLLAANGIKVTTTYDLLCEVRIASGQPPHYRPGTRPGYSLEQLAQANFGTGKTGSGAFAPELWQRGQRGSVIDYALMDVQITRRLFELGIGTGLKDPTNGEILRLKNPFIASETAKSW